MGIVEKFRDLIPTDSGVESDRGNPAPESGTTELTDEGQVLRVLVHNGGQVQKADLLAETGWAETEARDILARMEENNEVRILSRGSDTLVCRPGYEPVGHQKL